MALQLARWRLYCVLQYLVVGIDAVVRVSRLAEQQIDFVEPPVPNNEVAECHVGVAFVLDEIVPDHHAMARLRSGRLALLHRPPERVHVRAPAVAAFWVTALDGIDVVLAVGRRDGG